MLLLIAVSFLVFLAEAEIDMIVPSLPGLRAYFHTSVFEAELILTLNLLSHGISAIFMGAFGDRYGYKRVLLYGLFIFIFGSFLIIYSSSFTMVLIGRILQGAGMAAPMVLGYLIIIQNQPNNVQEKRISILNGVANTSLAFTPVLGSLIAYKFGWIGSFNFLFLLGFIGLFITCIFIPKSKSNITKADGQSSLTYISLFKKANIMLYIFCSLLFPAGWFIFIGMAPILYIECYHISLLDFGLYQGIIALIYGIFSFLSIFFIKKIGRKLAVIASLYVIILSSIILICGFIFNLLTPQYITAAFILGSIGAVIPVNSIHLFTMNAMQEAAGKINALIILGRWVLASIGIQISGFIYDISNDSSFLVISAFWIVGVILIFQIMNRDPSFKKGILEYNSANQ